MNNMVQLNSLAFYRGTGVTFLVWNEAFLFLALLPCVYISLGNHLRKRALVLSPSAYYPFIPIGIQVDDGLLRGEDTAHAGVWGCSGGVQCCRRREKNQAALLEKRNDTLYLHRQT